MWSYHENLEQEEKTPAGDVTLANGRYVVTKDFTIDELSPERTTGRKKRLTIAFQEKPVKWKIGRKTSSRKTNK